MTPPSWRGYRLVTTEEMRLLDRMAIEGYGIPSILLMENAGKGVAGVVGPMLAPGQPATVVCGKGNNGGDGFVIARHLHNAGHDARIVLVGSVDAIGATTDAGVNLAIARRMGLSILEWSGGGTASLDEALESSQLLVDALLGTGLSGEVHSPYREAIEAVNRSGKPVVAVDIPSGLDGDTGRILGTAVRATLTVTLGLPKIGFTLESGPSCTGEVLVIDISIPSDLLEKGPHS